MNAEQMERFVKMEMKILQWICGVSLRDKVPCIKLRENED